jgi:hypothetical protein
MFRLTWVIIRIYLWTIHVYREKKYYIVNIRTERDDRTKKMGYCLHCFAIMNYAACTKRKFTPQNLFQTYMVYQNVTVITFKKKKHVRFLSCSFVMQHRGRSRIHRPVKLLSNTILNAVVNARRDVTNWSSKHFSAMRQDEDFALFLEVVLYYYFL